MPRTLWLEIPDEIVDLVGSPEQVVTRARDALILDLLREAELSQGQAARLLGLTRRDMPDVTVRHRIPSGPESREELLREAEALDRIAPES